MEQYQIQELIEDYTKTISVLECTLQQNTQLTANEHESIRNTIKIYTWYIFNLNRELNSIKS